MSARTEAAELTVMVMVTRADAVVVQERRKGTWDGLIFPGGHVERGESFLEAAVREVREETGLALREVRCCGMLHWSHRTRPERYLVLLYRGEGAGDLLPASPEGRNFWMPLKQFMGAEGKAPAMDAYLSCFLGEAGELFAEYDDDGTNPLVRASASERPSCR